MAKVRNINTITLNAPTYRNNHELEEIDLAFVPWVNNSMYKAFENSDHLRSVININQNVTNMSGTFYECHNLINTPEIPNGVTSMSGTFYECHNLINTPEIPNSVIYMDSTFMNCESLTNLSNIPNGITTLRYTFYGCKLIKNAPIIPNSVTNMYYTFAQCSNLVNTPVIPNSVINLSHSFSYCTNVSEISQIPNSVISMCNTFYYCTNLINAPIIPNSVTSISSCFCKCYKLTSNVNVPDSIIGCESAYEYCSNIKSVDKISNNIVSLYRTFDNCTNLTGNIILNNENIYEVNKCFNGTLLNKDVYIPFKYTNNGSITYYAYKSNESSGFGPSINFVTPIDLSTFNAHGEYHLIFDNNLSLIENYSIDVSDYIHIEHGSYGVGFVRDAVNDITINYTNDDYTATYNAFISAGYSDEYRVHGALLIDINDEGIDLSDYEYTNISNDITLYNYIGSNSIITTPHLS